MEVQIKYTNSAHRNEVSDEQRDDYVRQVQNLDNTSLLEQYKYYAGGDDYDGCYTTHGKLVWQMIEAELEKRLAELGFFE